VTISDGENSAIAKLKLTEEERQCFHPALLE
jgi:hypothetical protein